MEKRILSSDDLRKMDIERLFSAIIALWGMEGASQIVQFYFDSYESEKKAPSIEFDEDDQEYLNAIMHGVDAFTELVIRKLKE